MSHDSVIYMSLLCCMVESVFSLIVFTNLPESQI